MSAREDVETPAASGPECYRRALLLLEQVDQQGPPVEIARAMIAAAQVYASLAQAAAIIDSAQIQSSGTSPSRIGPLLRWPT